MNSLHTHTHAESIEFSDNFELTQNIEQRMMYPNGTWPIKLQTMRE